jgi:hypothetical protein
MYQINYNKTMNKLFSNVSSTELATISSTELATELATVSSTELATESSTELAVNINFNLKELIDLCNKLDEKYNKLNDKITNNLITKQHLSSDAVITYKYGARCFELADYPDYVWRNNSWYKIIPDLHFEVDNTSIVNDSMISFILDDEIVFSYNNNSNLYYSTIDKEFHYKN